MIMKLKQRNIKLKPRIKLNHNMTLIASHGNLTSILSSPYISIAFSSERPTVPYSNGVNTVVGTCQVES